MPLLLPVCSTFCERKSCPAQGNESCRIQICVWGFHWLGGPSWPFLSLPSLVVCFRGHEWCREELTCDWHDTRHRAPCWLGCVWAGGPTASRWYPAWASVRTVTRRERNCGVPPSRRRVRAEFVKAAFPTPSGRARRSCCTVTCWACWASSPLDKKRSKHEPVLSVPLVLPGS